jgi:predicted nucleotidyltransferase
MIDLQQNRILQYQVGSKLYGTNMPDSDDDFSGVFIAPKEFYLGLSSVEQIDCSTISRRSDGKNDSDAIDFTMYEIRKFIKLALDNNPNVLEQLFVPRDKIVFADEFGKKLLKNAWLFPWKGLKQKFLGYAFSQRHKMMIKTDNYTWLIKFNDWIDEHIVESNSGKEIMPGQFLSSILLAELRLFGLPGIKFHEHHAQIGDLNISLTDKLSKVRNKVKLRLSKVGNREELYTKYGYDVKFGMHLVRLMLEGKELLLTGKLEYPLKERELLKDIRNGKWCRTDIIQYSEQLESEIEALVIDSDLPHKPQYDKIEKLLIEMVEEYWAV